MRNLFLLILCYIIFSGSVMAQETHTIRGTIVDSLGTPLPGTSIKLFSLTDTLATAAIADGTFVIKNIHTGQFQLLFTLIGFEGLRRRYTIDRSTPFSVLEPIKLAVSSRVLKGVTVTAVNAVEIKEDTIEYKASAYKVRPGSPVEELIRKLPGVIIDKDGNITAQGQQVTKIRVNGKDFFAGDVQTATKNIPADIIDKLQIIDDYGDQANITGIKTGDPEKILNLQIRKDRNKGYFMQGLLGIGNDGRYIGNLSAFSFQDQRQLSILGTLNNTNLSSFKMGSASSSSSQNANGIAITKSIGTNYRDTWGKHITVYGSFSFSDQNTKTLNSLNQQTFFQQNARIRSQKNAQNAGSVNHRFSFNMEYKPDTLNYLKITPGITYTVNSTDIAGNSSTHYLPTGSFRLSKKDSLLNSTGKNLSHVNSASPDANLVVLYNHRFHKKGRNFSANVNLGISQSMNSSTVDSRIMQVDSLGNSSQTRQNQHINDRNKNSSESVRLSYTEPLGKVDMLEFNYNLNNSTNRNQHSTQNIDPITSHPYRIDSLSNDYNYQFITNRIGVNYRVITKKYNYLIGLAAQPTLLQGESLTRSLKTSNSSFTIFPVARFVYDFSKGHSFTFRYNGSSNQPSFSQLQPVTDRSNPLDPVTGNPFLKAEFQNSVSFRYNAYDYKSGNILFANLSVNQVQHKIVSNSISRGDTVYTLHRNANGYYSVNGFYNYSKPFDSRRYTASLSGNVNYANNLSYVNDLENTGHSWVFSPTVKFRLDLDTLMDSEISANYTINKTKYSIPSPANSNARTWVFALNGRNYFFKDWILGYDLSKTLNHGFSTTVNANPTILNLYIERQFLKKNMASLRIQAFDLFNQNTGISRIVSANSITDNRVNRLARYFLLSFSLRLQKFAGKMPDQDNQEHRRDENRPGSEHRHF